MNTDDYATTTAEYDANGTNLLSGMTDAAAVADLRSRARGHDRGCAATQSERVFCTCGRAAITQAIRAIEQAASSDQAQ